MEPATKKNVAIAVITLTTIAFGIWYYWYTTHPKKKDEPVEFKPPMKVEQPVEVHPVPIPTAAEPAASPPSVPYIPTAVPYIPSAAPSSLTAHVALATPVDVSVAVGTFATRDTIMVDGIKPFVGMRVLLTGQTDGKQNGIWVIVELFQMWVIPNQSWEPAKHFANALLLVTGERLCHWDLGLGEGGHHFERKQKRFQIQVFVGHRVGCRGHTPHNVCTGSNQCGTYPRTTRRATSDEFCSECLPCHTG